MTTEPGFIIVGGGLAGAIAAQTLREEGFDGRITLLGEESNRPYERPPLSKDYLQGNTDRDSIFVHPESWYADHAVELRLGAAVTSLDPGCGPSPPLQVYSWATTSCCWPRARHRDA